MATRMVQSNHYYCATLLSWAGGTVARVAYCTKLAVIVCAAIAASAKLISPDDPCLPDECYV
jgi:hypothetical protein